MSLIGFAVFPAERKGIVFDKENLRQISIEGCKMIGSGAHSKVYRIAPDEIVKVYREDIPFSKIQQEKEKSRRALILGLPTAISFDIVKVGSCYGAVYELIDAESTAGFIGRSRENLDRYISMSVELLKYIHSIKAEGAEINDMKADHLEWVENVRDLLGDEKAGELKRMIEEVPDSGTLLHGDYHMKNIIICKGEPMLIDMDTLCFGDPCFDLATISNSYYTFPKMASDAATSFLGISVEDARYIWEQTLSRYYSEMNKKELAEKDRICRILGCLRILDFGKRGGDPVHKELIIAKGLEFISSLLCEPYHQGM